MTRPGCPVCKSSDWVWKNAHRESGRPRILCRNCGKSKTVPREWVKKWPPHGRWGEREEARPEDKVRRHVLEAERRHDRKTARISSERDAFVTLFKAALKGAAPELPSPPSAPEIKIDGDRTETLIQLLLADHHFGQVIIPSRVSGRGEWNSQRYADALWSVAVRLVRVVRAQYCSSNQILGLALNVLGDMGTDAHRDEHKRTNEMAENMAALNQGLILAQFTDLLLRQRNPEGGPLFPKIEIRCVPGNEPRMDKRVNWSEPERSWDMVTYWFWSLCAPETDRLAFKIPLSWSAVVEELGFRILLTHGHQVRGWSGFPLYGFWRFIGRQQALEREGGGLDFVFTGHHHQDAQLDSLGAQVHVTPPLVEPGGFAVNALALGGETGQTMLAMTARDGVIGKHVLRPREQDGASPFVFADEERLEQGARSMMDRWKAGEIDIEG